MTTPTRRGFLKQTLAIAATAGSGIAAAAAEVAGVNQGAGNTGRTKVLLDTDIGSDIDDAVALAYLLAEPRCDLLGVTTVSGQAAERAKLVSALCRVAGKEVPIFPGAETPLIIEQRQKTVPQAAKLTAWPHQKTYPAGHAVSFLRDMIRAHPGEIVLLAVGPLTNIALLFASDPELPGMIKELVVMAGKFTDSPSPWGRTEWNAIVDPHAARIVFGSKPPKFRVYGLDVTLQLSAKSTEVETRFKGNSLLEPVLDFSKVWFREREILHFHDPLAAVGIFDRAVCGYERGEVEVVLDGAEGVESGVTEWHPSPHGGVEVAMTVNALRFFRDYYSVFSPGITS